MPVLRILSFCLLVYSTVGAVGQVLPEERDPQLYEAQKGVSHSLLGKDREVQKRDGDEASTQLYMQIAQANYDRLIAEISKCRDGKAENTVAANVTVKPQPSPAAAPQLASATPTELAPTTTARLASATPTQLTPITTEKTEPPTKNPDPNELIEPSKTQPKSTTTAQLNNATHPVQTTTRVVTTTPALVDHCKMAVNYSESWRFYDEFAGSKPLAESRCDLQQSKQWFRFGGAAGELLLNFCPRKNSCGSMHPLWTDELPPKNVYLPEIIDVYSSASADSFDDACFAETFKVETMRCSWNFQGDIIYRYLGDPVTSCSSSFCGAPFED